MRMVRKQLKLWKKSLEQYANNSIKDLRLRPTTNIRWLVFLCGKIGGEESMKQSENNLTVSIEKASKAFNELGTALLELSKAIIEKISPVFAKSMLLVAISSDEKLRLWNKQYEVARGRKKARLKRKIKRREQKYIERYMK